MPKIEGIFDILRPGTKFKEIACKIESEDPDFDKLDETIKKFERLDLGVYPDLKRVYKPRTNQKDFDESD